MVKHNTYFRDGQPVKRKLVASFPGVEYTAQRDGDDLNVFWASDERADGEIRLISTFSGKAYIAETEDDGLSIYHISTENVMTETVGDADIHHVIGHTVMAKTGAAMRHGQAMTGDQMQALSEAARRGERPAQPVDRNAKAGAIQRAGEDLRAKGAWGK